MHLNLNQFLFRWGFFLFCYFFSTGPFLFRYFCSAIFVPLTFLHLHLPIFVPLFLFCYFCSAIFVPLGPFTLKLKPIFVPLFLFRYFCSTGAFFCSAIFVLLTFLHFHLPIFVLLFLFCWGLFALKPHLPHYLIDNFCSADSAHQFLFC